MKIGNIIALLGLVLCVLGFLCLPLWNLHEVPHLVDVGSLRGSGWISLVTTGLFARPGAVMIFVGLSMVVISKLLPKRYWKSTDEYLNDQINRNTKQKPKA